MNWTVRRLKEHGTIDKTFLDKSKTTHVRRITDPDNQAGSSVGELLHAADDNLRKVVLVTLVDDDRKLQSFKKRGSVPLDIEIIETILLENSIQPRYGLTVHGGIHLLVNFNVHAEDRGNLGT